MSLGARLSLLVCLSGQLFPTIEEDLGPLGERYQFFITVLELVRVEQHLRWLHGLRGRPQQDRALARAFIAKAVFHLATGHCLSGWPTIGRCAACAAGVVCGRSPARQPSRRSQRAPCRAFCQALIANGITSRAMRRRSFDAQATTASQAEAQARAPAQGRGTAAAGAPPAQYQPP